MSRCVTVCEPDAAAAAAAAGDSVVAGVCRTLREILGGLVRSLLTA